MKSQMTTLWWFLNDRIYPRLQPLGQEASQREESLPKEEKLKYEAQVAALPDDEKFLAKCLDGCARLLEEEDAARRGVEARLTSIVGLSSIAGTIAFSGILALATGTLHIATNLLRFVMEIGALYLALQVCWAILASLCGLERRGYIAPRASDILPLSIEARAVYLRRRITLCATRLVDDRLQNKEKVNQMALAHCAMKNFVGGLIVFAVLGTSLALAARNPSNDLIHTLRNNHDLHEMLRGPQGPKGDPGPPGPAGEPFRKRPPPPPKKR